MILMAMTWLDFSGIVGFIVVPLAVLLTVGYWAMSEFRKDRVPGQWGLMKVLPHDDQRILPLSQQAPSIKRAEVESGDPTVSRMSNPLR